VWSHNVRAYCVDFYTIIIYIYKVLKNIGWKGFTRLSSYRIPSLSRTNRALVVEKRLSIDSNLRHLKLCMLHCSSPRFIWRMQVCKYDNSSYCIRIYDWTILNVTAILHDIICILLGKIFRPSVRNNAPQVEINFRTEISRIYYIRCESAARRPE